MHVKMKKIALKTVILGTLKARIGREIVPGQSTRRVFLMELYPAGYPKVPSDSIARI